MTGICQRRRLLGLVLALALVAAPWGRSCAAAPETPMRCFVLVLPLHSEVWDATGKVDALVAGIELATGAWREQYGTQEAPLMQRFQAMTNPVLQQQLDQLRQRLGFRADQKAEFLRELTTLASWVVHQAEEGRRIEARRGRQVERLVHPVVERLRRGYEEGHGLSTRVELTDEEARRLATILDGGFSPTPGLHRALEGLAKADRQPPGPDWQKVP